MSRSALSLQRGEKVHLATLIQELQVGAGRVTALDAFEIRPQTSPIEYIKLQRKHERQRVRNLDLAADYPPSKS